MDTVRGAAGTPWPKCTLATMASGHDDPIPSEGPRHAESGRKGEIRVILANPNPDAEGRHRRD
jgi:hypothetical protein